MLGDTSTGKTSLVLKFVEGSYRDDRPPTIGAFFITKRLLVDMDGDSILCKISIWDTAGQAQFRPLAKMYYSHAAAAILCFSYSSRQSWQVVQFWLEELHRTVPAGNIVLCLCAAKRDVLPHVVSAKEVMDVAAANGAMVVETSAAKNQNVTQLFAQVAERVLQFQKKERGTGLGKIPVTPGATAFSDGRQQQQQQQIQQYRHHGMTTPTLTPTTPTAATTTTPTSTSPIHGTAVVNRYGVVVEEEEKKTDLPKYNTDTLGARGSNHELTPVSIMTTGATTAQSSGEQDQYQQQLLQQQQQQHKRRDKRTRSLAPVVEEEVNAPQPDMCGLIPANVTCAIS